MSVEHDLPIVRERKLAILKGDPELCDKQKKAGKLLADVYKRQAPGCAARDRPSR